MMKRIKAKGIEMVMQEEVFFGSKVVHELDAFKQEAILSQPIG
ncbi:hypothetical protein [Altericroceibacterium spongiae]|nr:hypothetical protein [Altericroceibacterium spongiae]